MDVSNCIDDRIPASGHRLCYTADVHLVLDILRIFLDGSGHRGEGDCIDYYTRIRFHNDTETFFRM